MTQQLPDDVKLVASKRIWGTAILVFAKASLAEMISPPKIAAVRTGVGSVLGNKGGVAVSFFVHETGFCFICAHLAARTLNFRESVLPTSSCSDMERIADRNRDFAKIMRGVSRQFVGQQEAGIAAVVPLQDCEADFAWNLTSSYRHVFFFGDLNYRIEADRDWVLAKMALEDYESLQSADQLKRSAKEGAALVAFTEGKLGFAPTYRYKKNEFDEKKGERVLSTKLRVPSWCDRILLASWPNSSVRWTSYGACQSLVSSDHTPVFSQFEITCPITPAAVQCVSREVPANSRWRVQLFELRAEFGAIWKGRRLVASISMPRFSAEHRTFRGGLIQQRLTRSLSQKCSL